MRILTFSDIHYHDWYSGTPVMIEYFNSFKEKLHEIHGKEPIDMAIICGDLAFSGDSRQYEELRKIIREYLPENIPVFSVVGNHDVNWSYLKEAIEEEDKVLSDLFSISKDTIKNKPKFKNVFKDYWINFQNKINENWISDRDSEYIINNTDTLLYSGYIYSEQKQILIILLNSSWYSFGPEIIAKYFKEWAKEKGEKNIIKEAINLFGDTLSQEGKQSYFFDLPPLFNEIYDLISKNNNLKVISFAHHPPSWLKWEELYAEGDINKYNILIKFSHILVTGHLHNPMQELSVIKNKCYLLNNGVFLDYHLIDSDKLKDRTLDPKKIFPNNWFNIIDITSEDREFKIAAYKFTSEQKQGDDVGYTHKWERQENAFESSYEYKKIDNKKNEDKKNNKLIVQGSHTDKFKLYFPKTILELKDILKRERYNTFKDANPSERNISYNHPIILIKDTEEYIVIINQLEEIYKIISDASDSNNYNALTENAFLGKILDRINTAKKGQLPIVAFYDIIEKFDRSDEHNIKAFGSFYNEKDIKFQSFKHKFFNNFCELRKFPELNVIYDLIIIG